MFTTLDGKDPDATIQRDGIRHELLHQEGCHGQVIRSTFEEDYHGTYLSAPQGSFFLYVLGSRLGIESSAGDRKVLHAGRYGWYDPDDEFGITVRARAGTRVLAVLTVDDAWDAIDEDV